MGFDAYAITIHREIVQRDAEGAVVAVLPGPTIHRAAEAIAGESVAVAGQTIPATLILGALPLFFDRWAAEEAAAAAEPPA